MAYLRFTLTCAPSQVLWCVCATCDIHCRKKEVASLVNGRITSDRFAGMLAQLIKTQSLIKTLKLIASLVPGAAGDKAS